MLNFALTSCATGQQTLLIWVALLVNIVATGILIGMVHRLGREWANK